MILADDRSRKANPMHNDDSRLLGIDRDRTAPLCLRNITSEGFAKDFGLARKMIGNPESPARMPKIPRRKSMAALRTTPQGICKPGFVSHRSQPALQTMEKLIGNPA